MSKKILIISSSPRKGGNSDLLCDEFMKGARGAGHDVEIPGPVQSCRAAIPIKI